MSASVLSRLFIVEGCRSAPNNLTFVGAHPLLLAVKLQLGHFERVPLPNPQSQSFSRSYGSILPTSLIYIILSTRGCTPWRPEAVMSTTRCANKSLHWIFKGRRERTGQCKRNTALPAISPFRRAIRFQGHTMLLKRKENSSQDSRQRLQFRLCYHSLSTFWFRNINLIPFR